VATYRNHMDIISKDAYKLVYFNTFQGNKQKKVNNDWISTGEKEWKTEYTFIGGENGGEKINFVIKENLPTLKDYLNKECLLHLRIKQFDKTTKVYLEKLEEA